MFTVQFRDGDRDITLPTPGIPLALPASVRVRRRGNDWLEIEPKAQGIGTEGPDVLVGELPIPFTDGRRTAVEWLALPPPSPLRIEDIATMWSRIADLGCPLPTGNVGQGVHSAAAAGDGLSPSPGVELLPHAHAAAAAVLARWPTIESSTFVWRPVDVPGGREDEGLTERSAGRWPAVRRADCALIPGRTARVMPSAAAWSSASLSATAVNVHRALARLGQETGFEVSSRRTFDLLARRAWPVAAAADQPLSSWPPAAADALRVMRSLLAALAAAAAGPRRAPLSYLWRLYEAWVAAELGHAFSAIPGVITVIPLASGADCDWHARYQVGGAEIIVVAQARLAASPTSCLPLEDAGLRSVTSVLRPDLIAAWRSSPDEEWEVVVFDAKHRVAGQPMDAGAVAEAGSKYLWGVRRESLERGVNRVVIVSTEGGGTMLKAQALIDSVRLVPPH
jgi:hypothetical protein